MLTNISYEEFVLILIKYRLGTKDYTYLKSQLLGWDCQDTEGNDETECYFYFSNTISKHDLDECKNRIAKLLGIPVDVLNVEDQTNDGNPMIRVDGIVTISEEHKIY